MNTRLLVILLVLSAPSIAADLLIPEGVTFCGGSGCRVNQNYAETGLIDGVNYRFSHYDASGGLDGIEGGLALGHPFAKWTTHCDKDAMTDAVTCVAIKDELMISYSPKAGYMVFVGEKHFPKSKAMIRVDENKAIEAVAEGAFGRERTQELLIQFVSGKEVRTRYTKWPYDNRPIDGTTSLYGVNQAIRFVKWAAHGGRPPN